MTRIRITVRQALAFAAAGLLGAGLALATPEVDAGRRGGRSGSVRHSSRPSGGASQRGGNVNRGNVNRGGNRGGSVNRGGDRGGNVNRGGDRNVNRGGDRNVNRGGNTNININRGGGRGAYHAGYHHGRADNRYKYREDARRDWFRYRTVNHALRLGAYVATYPRYSTRVVVTGSTYYYYGGTYYVSSGGRYVVVAPPPGTVVYAVPAPTTVVYTPDQTAYYYYGGTYYVPTDEEAERPEDAPPPPPPAEDGQDLGYSEQGEDGPEMIESDHNYKVVAPPVGATVPYLPEEADEVKVGDKTYHVFEDTYYQTFVSDGDTIYMVVEDPTGGAEGA